MKRLILFLSIVTISSAKASLNIFGYFDMEKTFQEGTLPEYDQHHLSLMFQHESEKFTFFSEVEYEHGSAIDHSSPTATGRGAIYVERAWAHAHISKYFNLRAGVILNNTNYEKNHFPTITVNTEKPKIVGKIFNSSIEGINASGNFFEKISYNLWHERSQNAKGAQNGGANYGGDIGYHQSNDQIDLKVSMLFGSYYLKNNDSNINNGKNYSTSSFGMDFALDFSDYTLWAEYGKKTDSKKDTNIEGYYLLLSKSIYFTNSEIVPFVRYESYKNDSTHNEFQSVYGFGLNYKPNTYVSIKTDLVRENEYQNNNSNTVNKCDKATLAIVYMFK